MSIHVAIARFDLEAYLAEFDVVDFGAEEYVLECPECDKPKLVVNVREKIWHCWVCEAYGVGTLYNRMRGIPGRGGLIDLVQWLERCRRRDAVEKILQGSRLSNDQLRRIEVDLSPIAGPDHGPSPEIPPPEDWRMITATLPYMTRRGITAEDARTFGLGWCSRGRYANRLIFPVWEEGRLVYYQGRAMWDPLGGHAKMLNPPKGVGVGSGDVLMNLDQARNYPRVAITEGPVDCVKTGPSAVASFGKRLSPRQIAKLVLAGVRAVDLMWDADAVPEMERTASTLRGYFDVRLVRLPPGTDPGDHDRHSLNQFRAAASGRASNLMEV